MMRTIIDPINAGAVVIQQVDQPAVDSGQRLLGQQSAGYTGLVRNDEDLDSELICLPDGPGGIGEEFEFFGTAKKIDLGIQRSVTIKENSDLVYVFRPTKPVVGGRFQLHDLTISECRGKD